jgi:uncharacterized damage-inducible protein DinB
MLPATTPISTSLADQLTDFAAYNLWANHRVIEWLQSKPESLFDVPVASSFKGIRATLLHIRDVERLWLGYLQPANLPASLHPDALLSHSEVMEQVLEVSTCFWQHISTMTDEALLTACCCDIPYVGVHLINPADILQHAMNHSTYHRGQLITIGHHLGFTDAPMSDYMYYQLLVKRQRMSA